MRAVAAVLAALALLAGCKQRPPAPHCPGSRVAVWHDYGGGGQWWCERQ